jgi:hypothetical protein
LHKNNAVNLGVKETGMRQRSHKLIVVLFLSVSPLFSAAQKLFQKPKTLQQIVGKKEFELKQWAYRSYPNYIKKIVYGPLALYEKMPVMKDPRQRFPDIPERYAFNLPAKYYICSLGVICKNELQFEKLTKVAFRFRLGSLDYVNWMEQKPNAVKPRY